jgi:formate hydrogenlyase transcriptional activator
MNEDNPIVFVVDDDRSIRESLRNLIRSVGLDVQTFASAQEFLISQRAEAPSCLVLDVKLPGLSGLDLQQELAKGDVQIPIIFITGYGDIPTTVRAMKAGAVEFLTKPFLDEDLLNAVEQAVKRSRQIEQLKKKPAEEKQYSEDELRSEISFSEIVGQSAALCRVLKQVETVAPTDSTVLIHGETGTGKELIARAIHNLSLRCSKPFVKINCVAIPTGLLESELFGHEKGAFTGAIAQRIGRFEFANGGTLFLDEIGDIPLELQPKLLRVLQEQEFERLGSTRTIHVDVRLVAATNSDLAQMVSQKQFRSDLYYRLNVFPIVIPPLRDRREDIPLLVSYFAQKYARRMKKRIDTIPTEVMNALSEYHWPGNVRELENIIERAVILSQGTDLHVSLPELKAAAREGAQPVTSLEAAEREHIVRALQAANWVIGGPTGAAAKLGMKRTTLQSKMQKLGISRPS